MNYDWKQTQWTREELDQMMNKITDLQQHAMFCINNYDYHHLNNEYDILNEQMENLKSAKSKISGLQENVDKFCAAIAAGHRRCDEIDELLINNGIISKEIRDKKITSNKGSDKDSFAVGDDNVVPNDI